MNRRAFLAGSAAVIAVPIAAKAQSGAKVYRIRVLETRVAALNAANIDAFRQGLRNLGYKEGQNLEIVYRSADGHAERFPDLARELVRSEVDLIVTRGTPATRAAKAATATIPVVMSGAGDPVGAGLVLSLGRPGGNVTGLSFFNVEIYAKRVELLRELLPGLTRLAGLFNMSNPVLPSQWREVERAARSFGIHPQLLDVRDAEDLPRAFDAAAKERAEGVVVALDGLIQANLRMIAELAVKHRVPSIYAAVDYVDVGGLLSYGPSERHMYQRAAAYVDKIFKGAKPGDLPVEQPTQFELVINLKTAKALGLTIPECVLARADQIIE